FAGVTVLDIDGGLSENYANTTVNNFIPGNVAIDSANQLAIFASKVASAVNLVTVDLKVRFALSSLLRHCIQHSCLTDQAPVRKHSGSEPWQPAHHFV